MPRPISSGVPSRCQGSLAPALAALERALGLAEPQGYVRIVADEGPAMARLLAAAQAGRPGYIATLLAAFSHQAMHTTAQAVASAPLAAPLAEPLSARELEVLELIAQGLSNSQISARLFLALSTVKGHNQRIFDKLQAQSRTEAVARARELGLI